MMSTQEPNTMAPQSALCICSRKWKAKLVVPIYFGTKTSEFCLRIISFSLLESELSFDLKDSKINFERARSTTVKSLLGAFDHFTIIISSDDREDLFADELLAKNENGKLDRSGEGGKRKQERNSRTALDGKLRVLKAHLRLSLATVHVYFLKVWLFY